MFDSNRRGCPARDLQRIGEAGDREAEIALRPVAQKLDKAFPARRGSMHRHDGTVMAIKKPVDRKHDDVTSTLGVGGFDAARGDRLIGLLPQIHE